MQRPGIEPTICPSRVHRPNHYPTEPSLIPVIHSELRSLSLVRIRCIDIRGQEEYLTTSAYVELMRRSDVIDEDVHQSQFVAESDERPQAARVQRDAVSVLGKLPIQLL